MAELLAGTRPLRDWAGEPYPSWHCGRCGARISAPRVRLPHVAGQHARRCEAASDEERATFRRTRRWPKRT